MNLQYMITKLNKEENCWKYRIFMTSCCFPGTVFNSYNRCPVSACNFPFLLIICIRYHGKRPDPADLIWNVMMYLSKEHEHIVWWKKELEYKNTLIGRNNMLDFPHLLCNALHHLRFSLFSYHHLDRRR